MFEKDPNKPLLFGGACSTMNEMALCASLPAEMRHFFLAKTAATFQVHGMGPFVVNYVNPADDPSKQQK
jgi:hypothetical protein